MAVLDSGDKMVQRLCPIIAGGVCVGSLYWTCVTFGAVTLMQTVGHRQGLVLMERADPLFLLVSLPLIPVGLVLGKMVRWEEPVRVVLSLVPACRTPPDLRSAPLSPQVLLTIRRVCPQIPLCRYVLPIFCEVPEREALQASLPPLSDSVSITRTFCGALFFPTIASFLGSALYPTVSSQLRRTLLGGLTFLAVKGMLKIYHKQHAYIRQCRREILDFKEVNNVQ